MDDADTVVDAQRQSDKALRQLHSKVRNLGPNAQLCCRHCKIPAETRSCSSLVCSPSHHQDLQWNEEGKEVLQAAGNASQVSVATIRIASQRGHLA